MRHLTLIHGNRRPVGVVFNVAGDVFPMRGELARIIGQVHQVEPAGHAHAVDRARGQHRLHAPVKAGDRRPVGTGHVAVAGLVGPDKVCRRRGLHPQTHTAFELGQQVRTRLHQTALGSGFARLQHKGGVVGLGGEHQQGMVATDLDLHTVGRGNQLAQLGGNVRQHLLCAGLAARAVALDRQVIAHHLVADVGLGNALERDGIAHRISATEHQAIALLALAAGLLVKAGNEALAAGTQSQVAKAFAARLGGKDQRALISTDRHAGSALAVEGVAQFAGHRGQNLGLAGLAAAVTQICGRDPVGHRGMSIDGHGDHIALRQRAAQGEHRQAAQALLIERQQGSALQHSRVGIAVGGHLGQAHPGRAAIGRSHQAPVVHRGQQGLAVGRHGDRGVGKFRGCARLRPAHATIGRQVDPRIAAVAGGQGHLHTAGHRHIDPIEVLEQGRTHHLAFAGHHQRKLHARERKAHRVQAGQIFSVNLAVVIGVFDRPAVDAGKGLQVAAAHRHHVVAGGAAVFEHQVAGGFFKAERAAQVEEAADRNLHIPSGADQRALVAVHIERALSAGAGENVQRFGREVDHQGGRILRAADAQDLVDLHREVFSLEGQRIAAHKAHLIGRDLQPHPAQATQAEGVVLELLEGRAVARLHRHFLAFEQGQGKFGVGQDKATGSVVGRVVFVDATIKIAVYMEGPAHTHKTVEGAAAHRQAVDQHAAAVGQGHRGG